MCMQNHNNKVQLLPCIKLHIIIYHKYGSSLYVGCVCHVYILLYIILFTHCYVLMMCTVLWLYVSFMCSVLCVYVCVCGV